jgi:hypothetical protein
MTVPLQKWDLNGDMAMMGEGWARLAVTISQYNLVSDSHGACKIVFTTVCIFYSNARESPWVTGLLPFYSKIYSSLEARKNALAAISNSLPFVAI